VVGGIARTLGCIALAQDYRPSPEEQRRGADPSTWVIVARDENALATLKSDPRWRPLNQSSGQPVWTDQFSNILSVAKWLNS
jgi:hypothetical protein